MPEQVPRKAGSTLIPSLIPALLLITTLALAAVPFWTLIASIIAEPAAISQELLRSDRVVFFLRSLGIAALIALIATCFAMPIARLLSARTTRTRVLLSALCITPIWLPPFMIYAAGNLLRAPDTVLGRAIIEFATSSPDRRWVTIWVGYAVAIIGLALWASPLAGVLIASGLGHRSDIYDDMLALEPIKHIKRVLFRFQLNRAVLWRTFALIAIVMLGSAVPLHLAQLDTWSIVIWRQLNERPPQEWGGVWVSALPLLITAFIGARLISSFIREANNNTDPGTRRPNCPRTTMLLALMLVAFATAIPIIAMMLSLNDPRSIAQFWRMNTNAVLDSGLTALGVGATTLLIALTTAYAIGSPARSHRRIAHVSILVLCVLGLFPGVLIGAAIAQHGLLGFDLPGAGPYWASLTRYAFIGAIIGALCAASESSDRRNARFQIAGTSPRAWCITTLPTFIIPILATLPIATLLAMFEIEAAIMVTPPGIENLPQQLLSDLHYARLEELSAAGVNLLGIGVIFAFVASALILRSANAHIESN
ncbi:MAG: hypothetical protein CMJ35_11545 [Phycisphaerae bacterium]|nr:hypothetical protein [Phycisphaerae bacterium]MBM92227.1 hypothetical protein [Phycisphaerae bacterium]